MAGREIPPPGHRARHHLQYGRRTRKEVARLHHDHAYHAQDEELSEILDRLDALERPTTDQRLRILRLRASARKIIRRDNKEANWLVENDDSEGYPRRLGRHQRNPDDYPHPGSDGYALTNEDKLRIGPTRAHVHLECDYKIDELRPTNAELLVRGGAGVPGSTALLTARHNAIRALRKRARLLTSFSDLVDSEVPDNYFEPALWEASHGIQIRDYARLAELGEPVSADDPRHIAAGTDLNRSVQDEDLIGIAKAHAAAKGDARWANPPSLPSVTVTGGRRQLTFSWSGNLPTGVIIRSLVVLVSPSFEASSALTVLVNSPGTVTVQASDAARAAVLVRHFKDNAFTTGTATVVNVTT